MISAPRPWLYKMIFNVVRDGTVSERRWMKHPPPRIPLRSARAAEAGPRNSSGKSYALAKCAVLRLRSEGLSYDEIAYALGLQIGTVGAMLSRAVVKIKRHMAESK